MSIMAPELEDLEQLVSGDGALGRCEFSETEGSKDRCPNPATRVILVKCSCGDQRLRICNPHFKVLAAMQSPECTTCNGDISWLEL